MNHYVYRIDRPSTGEYYIGVRSSMRPIHLDGAYMGSGPRIKEAVRCHGRSQFTKTIIARVFSRESALDTERRLVGPDQVCDPLCLNMAIGGGAGPWLSNANHAGAWNKRHAAKERERWAAGQAERDAKTTARERPSRGLFDALD
tara:strand:- start:4588 stop:5022 length:435 start_codon:yes stop_codon:yes gene_type:complete